MNLPPQLEADISSLKEEGWSVTVERNQSNHNQIFIVIKEYPLPKGWTPASTELLIITDVSYPNSKPDMFWVTPDVRLEGGRMPTAGCFESYPISNKIGQQWLRFSWHLSRWNPATDNLSSYLSAINARLGQLI